MPDLVAVGECMIELFSTEPIRTAQTFHTGLGGDTLNVLTMASKLGTSCGYISRIGDDSFAEFMMDAWRRDNVDTAAVKKVRGFTGVSFISQLPGGDRQFAYYRKGSAASTIVPDDLDPDYIGGARILHISAILQAASGTGRHTVLRAAQIARDRNVTVSFDTNLRLNLWSIEEAREALEEIIPYVDIIFPSHPVETKELLGLESEAEVIEHFQSRQVPTVAVKSGDQGVWVGTAEGIYRVKALAPRGVTDTTGAGDAFVGAFLHCLAQGMDAKQGARWGVVSAGLKVAGRGAVSSQPTLEEVEEHLGSVETHRV